MDPVEKQSVDQAVMSADGIDSGITNTQVELAVEGGGSSLPTPVEMGAELNQLGFEHFIAQADLVTKTLFIILIVMSIISWMIIIYKFLHSLVEGGRSRRFLHHFWRAESLAEVVQFCGKRMGNNPYGLLTEAGLQAVKRHRERGGVNLKEAGTLDQLLTRTLRTKLDEEQLRSENGSSALATVAASAPFVGLFGTVWGIYHALIEIGSTGAGTIDKVAGPVGEALIMTGVGLAVAIPAVIAYNWVARKNQVKMGRLDSFAFDLLTFLGEKQSTPLERSGEEM